MKTCEGVEVYIHAFFTSALDGGEWSASRHGRFTPRERDPNIHWIGGRVVLRSLLDAERKMRNGEIHCVMTISRADIHKL
jgi:hypothetical protein